MNETKSSMRGMALNTTFISFRNLQCSQNNAEQPTVKPAFLHYFPPCKFTQQRRFLFECIRVLESVWTGNFIAFV